MSDEIKTALEEGESQNFIHQFIQEDQFPRGAACAGMTGTASKTAVRITAAAGFPTASALTSFPATIVAAGLFLSRPTALLPLSCIFLILSPFGCLTN